MLCEHTRSARPPSTLGTGESWRDANLVFCRQDGTAYTRDALNWRFGKVARRAGIGHWHAHEGRHTAVSIVSQRCPDPGHH